MTDLRGTPGTPEEVAARETPVETDLLNGLSQHGLYQLLRFANEIIATRDAALASQRATIVQLREALIYVLRVRDVQCQHKHPAPDKFCARCTADAALSPTTASATTGEVGRAIASTQETDNDRA